VAVGAEHLLGPTVTPLGGDLVEALVRVGDRARANDALAWLDDVARRTGLVHRPRPRPAAVVC